MIEPGNEPYFVAAVAIYLLAAVFLLRWLLRLTDRRRRPPDVVATFYRAETETLTIEGDIKKMQLKEGQRVRGAIRLRTKRGNLARFQEGTARFTSSDPSVATITQNPDNSLEFTIEGVDGSENETVLIEFRADGDPGDGVRDIIASKSVTVTQGDAFVAEMDFDAPEDIPADDDNGGNGGVIEGPADPGPAAEDPETGNGIDAGGTNADVGPGSGSPGSTEPGNDSTPAEPSTGTSGAGSSSGDTEPGNVPAGSDIPTPAPETGTGEPAITTPADESGNVTGDGGPADPNAAPTPTIDPSTIETPAGNEPNDAGGSAGSVIPGNEPGSTPADRSDNPDRADTPDLHPTPANPFDSEAKPGDADPAPKLDPADIPPHDKQPGEARPLPVDNPGREPGGNPDKEPKPLTDERP